MKIYIHIILLMLIVSSIYATNHDNTQKTDTNIKGYVIDKKTKEPLPYITIGIKGTTIGTTTDATGHYFIKSLPLGKYTLIAKYIGYKTQEIEITTEKGKTFEINFELDEENFSLNEIVVSANRNETSRRLAPTLVSILDVKTFDRTNSVSLSQGLNFQPGLRVENNCQNCGFTQVRMNGLDGAYSQILIDSRPVFSALAGVYGLEQIPANMIERVEVVRGGGSALYGSSAIAGTINIITKEPIRNTADVSHTIMAIGGKSDFDNVTSFNASLVSDNQKMGLMVFGQKRHRSAYDHDDDGFSEIPKLDSRTLGFRSFIKTGTYSKFTLEYHNINEFRRGGDNLNKPPHEAYIAEQIDSKIDVGSIKYDILSPNSKHKISIYTSAQLVNRDSYYGGGNPALKPIGNETPEEIKEIMVNYENRLNSYGKSKDVTYSIGGQYSYNFDKLLFMPSEITTGLEYNHDKLEDRSGFRNNIEQSTNIKSFFAQNEWKNDKWSFLIGGRLDKHNFLDDVVFSPRANLRFNPISDVNIRLSYGKGFRAPQLFDEDLHVDIAGGAHIISKRDPNLKEEKSHSFSGSVDWYHQIGRAELNFLAEGFFTILKDPFTHISTPQNDETIIKTITNASGAKVYGINIEARAAYSTLLQFQLGATIQKSRYDDAQKWSDDDQDKVEPTKKMMRTPDVYGYFVATINPIKRLNATLSGNYTGSMLVPHEAHQNEYGVEIANFTKDTRDFFELNCKLTYEIPLYKGTDIEFNAGIQNIFNAYQKDFDKGSGRASSYTYGPSLPRSYFAGAKICF